MGYLSDSASSVASSLGAFSRKARNAAVVGARKVRDAAEVGARLANEVLNNSVLLAGARRRRKTKKAATKKRATKKKTFEYDSSSDSDCWGTTERVLMCNKRGKKTVCKSKKVHVQHESSSDSDSSSDDDIELKCRRNRRSGRVVCKKDNRVDGLSRLLMSSLADSDSSDASSDDCAPTLRLTAGARAKKTTLKKKKTTLKKKKTATKKRKVNPAFRKWIVASKKARATLARKYPSAFKGQLVLINKGTYGRKWYKLAKKLYEAAK